MFKDGCCFGVGEKVCIFRFFYRRFFWVEIYILSNVWVFFIRDGLKIFFEVVFKGLLWGLVFFIVLVGVRFYI